MTFPLVGYIITWRKNLGTVSRGKTAARSVQLEFEMEIVEIFLSKLSAPEALYKEVGTKLGAGEISGEEQLEGALLSCDTQREYHLYISDEDIVNETVESIIAVFRKCEKSCGRFSVETHVDEFLNLIDDKARMTHYSKPRSLVHRDGDLHPTVHIWLIKRKDMGIYALLQKRSSEKQINPDCFDVSAAGHVSQGEEFRHAAVKELREELGLSVSGDQLELIGLHNHLYTNDEVRDNELSAVYLYRGKVDTDKLVVRSSEVSEVGWVEIDELLSVMKNEDIPNCISLDELSMIKKAVF